ncbi:unnamed protein product [Discula destructiva]
MVLISDILAAIAAALHLKATTTSAVASASSGGSPAGSLTTLYKTSTFLSTSISSSLKCQYYIGFICVNPTRVISATTITVPVTYAYTTETLIPPKTTPGAVAGGSTITTTLFSTSTSASISKFSSTSCQIYYPFGFGGSTRCLYYVTKIGTKTSNVPVTVAYTTQTIVIAPSSTSNAVISSSTKPSPSSTLTSAPLTSSTPSSTTQATATEAVSTLSSSVTPSSSPSTIPPSSSLPPSSSSAAVLSSSESAAKSSSSSSPPAVASSSSIPDVPIVQPSSSTPVPDSPATTSAAVEQASSSSTVASTSGSVESSSSSVDQASSSPFSTSSDVALTTSSSPEVPSSSSVAVLTSSDSTPSSSDVVLQSSSTPVSTASGPSCTATVPQTETDNAGNVYTIYCSSDSTLGSYSSGLAAISSYQDCMTACDNDAASGCAGFTYVGGADGSGAGLCWLRIAGGTQVPAGNSFVVGVKGASAAATSSSTASLLTADAPSSFITLPATPSSSVPSTTAAATASSLPQPTCGLNGYASTADVGYYLDASLITYAGCMAYCEGDAACQSFAIGGATPACILYGIPVEGNTVADPASPYVFYDKDGSCPPTPVVTSTTTTTSSAAVSTKTGAYPFCPAGIVPFIYGTYTGTYTPCDSNPYSTCAQDVDGSAYCNTCGSCYNARSCTADSDCTTALGAGYACITGSACTPTVNGHPNGVAGAPVCLYMLAGGSAHGCYGADSN